MNKRILFVVLGHWYLYHRIAESLKHKGFSVDVVTMGSSTERHLQGLGIYENVYNLSALMSAGWLQDAKLENYDHFFGDLGCNEIIKTDRQLCSRRRICGKNADVYFANLIDKLDYVICKNAIEGIVFEPSTALALFAEAIAEHYCKKSYYPQWPRTSLGIELGLNYKGLHNLVDNKLSTLFYDQLSEKDIIEATDIIQRFNNKQLKPILPKIADKTFILFSIANKIVNYMYAIEEACSDKYSYNKINNITYQFRKPFAYIRRVFNSRLVSDFDYENSKYFFYALHFDPDLSSLLWSRTLQNQVEAIRLISMNLPLDHCLVVKEHPAMNFNRKYSFYKSLLSNYNVKFVSEKIDPHSLILNSVGVVTLCGTVAFESIFYRKKPIVLGNEFYSSPKLVTKVDNFKKLKDAIAKTIENDSITEEDLILFTHAYKSTIIPMKVYSHYSYKSLDFNCVLPLAEYIFNDIHRVHLR